jgi:hypothetical protein
LEEAPRKKDYGPKKLDSLGRHINDMELIRLLHLGGAKTGLTQVMTAY